MYLALALLSGWFFAFAVGLITQRLRCSRFLTNMLMTVSAPVGIIISFILPTIGA